MAKGLFTQGMCILLREPLPMAEIEARLKRFEIVGRHESVEDEDAPETLVLAYRPEVGGHLLVTPSRARWPDDMGDPDESPERFVAWSLGQFGPLAFPGCLRRAAEQSWGWEGGAEAAEGHTAHVRMLISYVLGADEPDGDGGDDGEDPPLVPEDYDALDELKFLTQAISAVLEAPASLCYFNPGGEVLRDETGLRQGLNYAWSHQLPPLDMWTNVRLFRADDQWSVMDTVGNGQFDLPDLEAIFETGRYQPSDVEQFLRSASLYMLQSEEDVDEGDTADGPGNMTWRALDCDDALSDPPRPTVRWVPQDGSEPSEELLATGELDSELEEDEEDFEEENYPDPDLGDDLDEEL